MRPETKQRMDALLSSGSRLVLETYIEELIDDTRKEYDQCNRDTFEAKKGEIRAYIRLLNHVRGNN